MCSSWTAGRRRMHAVRKHREVHRAQTVMSLPVRRPTARWKIVGKYEHSARALVRTDLPGTPSTYGALNMLRKNTAQHGRRTRLKNPRVGGPRRKIRPRPPYRISRISSILQPIRRRRGTALCVCCGCFTFEVYFAYVLKVIDTCLRRRASEGVVLTRKDLRCAV